MNLSRNRKKRHKDNHPRKIFVGMSGGVDSSLSAALLKDEGHDVTGVFIKAWHPEWAPCNWIEDRRDAMRVAARLPIPFLTLDLEKEYKKSVVDYMVSQYKAGRTPNPDVMCNKHIKFGHFLEYARRSGAEYVATGHYAKRDVDPQPQISEHVTYTLLKGEDKNKDQSYFLWTLTQAQLKHILFPIGHLQKSRVRELARKFDLPNALKKDSQGLCFVGKIDMKDFLGHYLEKRRGDVVNIEGKKIGTHDGALLYTIGERHGFTVMEKTPHDPPYYIVAKDTIRNTITVAHKRGQERAGGARSFTIDSPHWIGGVPDEKKNYTAQVRYRQQEQKVKLRKISSSVWQADFSDIQVAAAGQSLVVYDGEVCVGGGTIVEA